ncbi:MAG: hypothetical protein Q4G60_12925 [bacterium]|nr:hypothetical protein [bacterium]
MKNSEYGNDNYIWDVKSPEMFERFAAQLQEYTRTNTLPVCADQAVQYVLELQRRRLSGKNLQMFYQISPRGHFGESTPFRRTWSDNRYVSEMTARSCELTRTIFKDKKQIYHKVQKKNLYQTITDAKGYAFIPKESYICPNCGASCKVDEQNRYCSYCGTYFEMPDLFPKVTNYFFLEDVGGTEHEIKQEILRFVKPCILLACILYTIFFAFQGDKSIIIRDKYVYVTVEVYMDVLYYDEACIREKEEKFKMQLYRRIDKPIDYHFTVREMQCKHCGASFDATKQRRCPHCNQAYDLADDDWIVTGVA